MNTFSDVPSLFSESVIEWLGWVLVHSLWQFAVVAVMVAVSMLMLRRHSANVRYVTLVAALSLATVLPVITWFWMAVPSTENAVEASVVQDADPIGDVNSATTTSYEIHEPQGASPGFELPGTEASALRLKPSDDSVSGVLQPWFPWIVGVWSVGVIAFCLRPLLGWRMLRRLRRVGISTPSDELRETLDRISQRMGMNRAVKLCCSTLATGPLLVGYFRPIILLPVSLVTSIPTTQLEAILAHELAHVRRHDFAINLLQTLAETLFFYHPAVWWLSRRVRIEREYCCDDLVVKLLDNAPEYGRALIAVEQTPGCSTSLALGANDGSLLDRVQRIVDVNNRRPTRVIDRRPAVLLSLLSVLAMLLLAWNWSAMAEDDATVQTQPLKKEVAEKINDKNTSAVIDGKFHGHVTGPDGQPFAGAKIHFVSYANKARTLGPVLTTSDANGHFEFEAPPLPSFVSGGRKLNREGLIFAAAEGHAPDWMEMWSRQSLMFREYQTPWKKGQQIELQLAKDDVPINGQFLDAGGKPLIGARVQMTQLMVPRYGGLDGHLDHWSKANASARFLSKAPTYKRELTWMHVIPNLTTETVTDDEGRFTLKGIGRDRLARLKVTAPNVQTTYVEVMARDAPNVGMLVDFDGNPTMTVYGANFSLQLKRGLLVKGIVRDRDTEAPVEGMWVAWRYNPLTHPPARKDAPVTDQDGRFTLSGLDPVLLTLEEKQRGVSIVPQPGMLYVQSRGIFQRTEPVDDDLSLPVTAEVAVECVKGIRFRLKLVDESGQPVERKVEYRPVYPNNVSRNLIQNDWRFMNHAALRSDGTYEGWVLPGPGAITVKMPNHLNWRPAFVDPKAFYEPKTTDWSGAKERYYGTTGILNLYGTTLEQTEYNAIVLVNPPKNSDPLKLTATIDRARPRQVTLIDSGGKPVNDVDAVVKSSALSHKETHRSATFPLLGLHPDRVTQITFRHDDRQLVAILLARGDDESLITVQMQPWGTLTGRVVDVNGNPLRKQRIIARATDDGVDRYHFGDSEADGRFEAKGLIPGLTYRIEGKVKKLGFVTSDGNAIPLLKLKPGQNVDIGVIRLKSQP